MARWANKEEYAKWKAERGKNTGESDSKLNENQPNYQSDADEKTVWSGKPDWAGYFVAMIIVLVLSLSAFGLLLSEGNLAGFIMPFVIAAFLFVYRSQFIFTVTNRRIIAKRGVIGRRTGELDIKDIRSINISQGIFQRVFKIGDIEFASASGPIKEVTFLNIKDADFLKEKIRSYKNT
jgi:uncharacterized membrane protein YdbT with pleckstrin-like domain